MGIAFIRTGFLKLLTLMTTERCVPEKLHPLDKGSLTGRVMIIGIKHASTSQYWAGNEKKGTKIKS